MKIPWWLKIIYTAWIVIWIPAYWIGNGPANFLWLCDVANFVLLIAMWTESTLLVASQAVAILLVQLLWAVDYFSALLFDIHPIGGTEYMFDHEVSPWLRGLSFFHLTTPPLVIWMISRLGYDVRGWRLQIGICWVVLLVSYFLTDPQLNINWLQRPFEIEQTWLSRPALLGAAMVLLPAIVYYPTHLVLLRWFKGSALAEKRPADKRTGRPTLS